MCGRAATGYFFFSVALQVWEVMPRWTVLFFSVFCYVGLTRAIVFCPCRSLVAPYRRNFPHPCPPSGDPFVRTEVPTSTVAKPYGGLSGAMLGSTNNISHPRGSLFDDDVGLEEKEQLETFPQPVVTSDSMASPPRRVVSHIICWRMLRRAMWPFGLFEVVAFSLSLFLSGC